MAVADLITVSLVTAAADLIGEPNIRLSTQVY